MRSIPRRLALLLGCCALACASARPEPIAIAVTPAPIPAPTAPAAPAPVAQAAQEPAPPEAPPPPVETEETEAVDVGGPPAPAARRGWLGVELEPAGSGEFGARIVRVVPGSPAERGGLLAGDLIQRIDGESIGATRDVVETVAHRGADARLGLAVKRQGADRLLSVTLGPAPDRDELYRMSFVDLPAPDFVQLSPAKGSFAPTLRAQRGHVLVVEFWASWCVACRALIPHMNRWHAEYGARGLRMVGITGDPVARAATAAANLGMEYPVASDESGRTAVAYNARAIPVVFVIDRQGTVRDVMVGYDAGRLPRLDELVRRLLAER